MGSILIARKGSSTGGINPAAAGADLEQKPKTVVSIVLDPDDHGDKDRRRHKQQQHSHMGFSMLLSNIYALLLILFGIMFPLSEALLDYWHQTHYTGAFLVYIYVVATVFLLYLQCYILPASSREIRARDRRKQQRRSEQLQRQDVSTSNTHSLVLNNPAKLDLQSLKGIHRDVIPAISQTSPFRRQSAPVVTDGNQTRFSNQYDPFDNGTAMSVSGSETGASCETLTGSEEQNNTAHVWVGLDSLKDLFAHDGSSFYLRTGALVFGIGNLIYIGLEMDYLYSADVPVECNRATYGWTFILRMIYVVVQTFFLFKNSDVHITTQHTLTRFGFKHLIATNICVWVRTLINEILQHAKHVTHEPESEDHGSDYSSGSADLSDGYSHDIGVSHAYNMDGFNTTGNDEMTSQVPPHVMCQEYSELLRNASPYLFPFILEYSLIAAGIFAIMCSEISHEGVTDVMSNLKHVLQSHRKKSSKEEATNSDDASSGIEEEDTISLQNYAGPLHTHGGKIDLTSSHRGMFLGFLCLAGALVTTILFFNDIAHDENEQAQLTYLAADIAMEVLTLVCTIMSLYSMKKLSLNSKPLGVDDILLLIAMAGSFLFQLSLIISDTFILVNESIETGCPTCKIEIEETENEYLIILSLVSATLASFQIILQTILIISGLRRYSGNKYQVKAKPGREAITFLVVTNVTLWIFGTAQIKNLELGIQEAFYGTLAWLFILNLNLPLYLFFRFHSSVCLADIWNVAYRPVTPELEFTEASESFPMLSKSPSRNSLLAGAHPAGEINPAFSHQEHSRNIIDCEETAENIVKL